MATQGRDSIAEPSIRRIDQELRCPICLGRLEVPKSLNCLHCLCKKCLNETIDRALGDDKNAFNCPTCRESHPISDPIRTQKADAFKTHFTICNMIELLMIQESEEKKEVIRCTNSNDTNPATHYCGECQCYLCTACLQAHGTMKATRKHNTVSIAEINNDPKKMVHRRYCTEHDEELKVYCLETQEVICRDGELDDDHRDKNHTHKLVKSVVGELKSDLKSLKDDVVQKHKDFVDHETYIDHIMKESHKNTNLCHKNIAAYFEAYRKRLDAHEEHLHNTITRYSGEASKHMQGEKEAVQVSKAKLLTGIEYTEKLLESPNPVDIAMMSKQTKNRLKDLKQEEWDRNTVQVNQWAFHGSEKDPFASLIRGGINRSEIKLINLGQPIFGSNQFKIQLDEGVESQSTPTVTLTRNGERMQNFTITKDGSHCWNVQYDIPGEGEYEVGVAVDGVEAEKSPLRRIWRNKLSKGMLVDRGRDWKWGDQNGGVGNRGTVMGWASEVGASDNWVKVKWKSGRQNNYRWGAEGAYDLMILKVPDLKFTAEDNLD